MMFHCFILIKKSVVVFPLDFSSEFLLAWIFPFDHILILITNREEEGICTFLTSRKMLRAVTNSGLIPLRASLSWFSLLVLLSIRVP